jgi:uridine phosphorylase
VFCDGVGALMAAGLLEEAVAFGCSKFLICGGRGVLEYMLVGKLMLVESGVRDEGVSCHYVPPGREIWANPKKPKSHS